MYITHFNGNIHPV